jgi:hypothetical protein
MFRLSCSRSALMVPVVVACLAACANEPAGPGGAAANVNNPQQAGNNGVTAFLPANPGPGFVRASTTAEQNALIQDMWTALTRPACWDASSFLPVGHVSQFQFFNQNEFRHYGFTINFGTVFLHDIGHYQGKETAIVETWTGEVEALVIVNRSTIAHIFPHIDGKSITVLQYAASNGPCL